MGKKSRFSKVLKLIVTLIVYGAKTIFVVASYLGKKLFKGISKRLRFSITFKTASFYTLIFSVFLFILSVLIVSAFGAFFLYETRDSLEKSARVTQSFVGAGNGIPKAKIKQYAGIDGITITLLNSQKEVTYTTGENQNSIPPKDDISGTNRMFVTGFQYLHVSTLPKLNKNVYYIVASKSLSEVKLYLLLLMLVLSISFVFTVILTVSIGSRILKNMLKPIDNMIVTAKSAKDLRTRLNVVDSHDELKELAETFNEMLDRIQISYEQQNRFVSDASHELRTPISVIQGYANLLQRWGKEDREVLEESIGAIKNEAESMKDLVERLLFLARADKDTLKLEKCAFSMHELVDEVLRETKLIDAEHNISSETNEMHIIEADRGLIKQALRIFVDNSIKFTPSGGQIIINSFLKDRQAILIIKDSGTGISKEDLPHIFERFYKCDKSRQRQGGGAGLGLAISKWIIEKHKGTIGVESGIDKGTKIIIALPL